MKKLTTKEAAAKMAAIIQAEWDERGLTKRQREAALRRLEAGIQKK